MSLENAAQLNQQLKELVEVYPFNEFEYMISHLLAADKLTIEEYNSIRSEYIKRNKYQHLYDIASRSFGEVWIHPYLRKLVPNLREPLSQEYDFLLPPDIRVEAKASRATNSKAKGSFASKAILFESNAPFVMNFQQMKPRCCDVFVWLGVWRDTIKHWVIPSFEVENIYTDKQHRGNVGEGQYHVKPKNIHLLDKYLVEPEELESIIRKVYEREKMLRGRI
jgi:hypothetical protein